MTKSNLKPLAKQSTQVAFWQNDFKLNKSLYLLVLPVVIYYILFCYVPMYGLVIAFQDFEPSMGFLKSPWVGLTNFIDFFNSMYFYRLLKNTLTISVSSLIFGFPAPIILAILMNELGNKKLERTVQTVTYMPHFISIVVVCGLIKSFTTSDGVITDILVMFGGEREALLMNPRLFVPIYVISDIWQEVGWTSIIYLAALTGIDTQLYEACKIDGGGRFRQILSVTLPGILPTVIIMFILRMGNLLSVGFEKIILLYNPSIYDVSDVISSYVYRKGIQEFNISFGTAVGVFNSAINVFLLLTANHISRNISEISLW